MGLSKHDGVPEGNSPVTTSNESSVQFLQASLVWQRYGVSYQTINRWVKDERIAFPPPIYAGSRTRLWKLSELETWEARQPRRRGRA